MRHSNCKDCGAVILPKATRCRPCNFKYRKERNAGIINFKCPACGKVFAKVDRGNVKNATVLFCSQNCHHAALSASKIVNKEDRQRWARARHRARAYVYKMGIKPSEVRKLFETLVCLYIAKEGLMGKERAKTTYLER